ncbi:MAG: TldD/PmbA family protein [Deltaproteobacteria bacterium]|nr:TldD/PmbA family protein [Deltaproteobacteria bacterium]
MKVILGYSIDELKRKRLDYGDVRYERVTTENIQVRNGIIEGFSTDSTKGVGIRVLYKGAWGHAANHVLTERDVIRTVDEALSIAKAFSSVNPCRVRLSENPPHRDTYKTPFKVDPFSVPPEEKVGLLVDLTTTATRFKDIAVCEAFMEFTLVEKEFLSTEGAHIRQTILLSGVGYHVIAEDGNDVQVMSYPDSHNGIFAAKGYELVQELKLMESLERVCGEAKALLKAKECPTVETDIILDGSQLALQLHESAGHPLEMDRVLGSEISFAGGSFLSLEKRGRFRYGSRDVNIYGDPTHEGGAGSYRYDDEGVMACRVDLVREGVFLNYLTSRESSSLLGERSNGSMRASSWSGMPLVRMSNICIKPGEWALEDLIKDTKKGFFLSTNRSWSIDDLRLNFQFGTEIAYEIKGGKLGQIYKNPVYYGITPDFWNSCDGVCGRGEWRMWGLNSCAKGEPVQIIYVGHGTAPARFRNVSVGVRKR